MKDHPKKKFHSLFYVVFLHLILIFFFLLLCSVYSCWFPDVNISREIEWNWTVCELPFSWLAGTCFFFLDCILFSCTVVDVTRRGKVYFIHWTFIYFDYWKKKIFKTRSDFFCFLQRPSSELLPLTVLKKAKTHSLLALMGNCSNSICGWWYVDCHITICHLFFFSPIKLTLEIYTCVCVCV